MNKSLILLNMKKIAVLIFMLVASSEVVADIDAKLSTFINLFAVLQLNDEFSPPDTGKEICQAAGISSLYCNSVNNIGEGICLAGGTSSLYCGSVNNIGEGICLAGGISSLYCDSVSNVGEGICLAGGISSLYCDSVSNVGEGICLAGGISSLYCDSVSSIGEGICLSRGKSSYSCDGMSLSKALDLPVVDTEWKWDKFASTNTYGNIWGCRGTRTGKFADDYKCAGEVKWDDTWPNN